jgi:hypothetical protein
MTIAKRKQAIESLRTFATEHATNRNSSHYSYRAELSAFVHMCTAALDGQEWAVKRVTDTLRRIDEGEKYRDADQVQIKLSAIRATDTTRPDGAIAKSIEV